MSKIFILDTNVLLHDPKSLTSFQENDVVIPLVVLDELDKKKTGVDEVARHARIVIRTLDEMRALGNIHEGIKTEAGGIIKVELDHSDKCPVGLDSSRVDNRLIGVALGIKGIYTDKKVILVTKDINLRVKGNALGIDVEDYNADSVAEDAGSIYSGTGEITTEDDSLIERVYTNGFIPSDTFGTFFPNQYLHLKSTVTPKKSVLVRYDNGSLVKIMSSNSIWGISSRNKEQAYALDALFNPDIKLVTMIGTAGTGKAQPLDAKIMTPGGWKNMGDVCVGDRVCTPDGTSATVTGTFPQGKKDIYRVHFTDNTSTECCKEHLWHTKTQLDRDDHRSGTVKSLEEIMNSLRYGKLKKRNHSIPITLPIQYESKSLPLDPYLLGALIGDGSLLSGTPSFTSADEYIINKISCKVERYGLTLKKRASGIDFYISKARAEGEKRQSSQVKNKLTQIIKEIDLYGRKSDKKFIPDIYKLASVEQRIELLQGLMDTDGSVAASGDIEFTSTSRKLALDVIEIVRSLGGTSSIAERITTFSYKGEKKFGKPSFRCRLVMPNEINPFTLPRKVEGIIPRTKYFPRRYIDRVEYVGKKEAKCIYIDSNDHLYITDDFIVTHNTLMAVAAGISQLLDSKDYRKLIMSRPVQPMGKDLGFLPGTLDEKMAPWMAPLQDNLDLLFSDKGSNYLDMQREAGLIEVEALTYIRGRSIPRSFIIIDEAQNLSLHEAKTIITRIGAGSKIIFTGDILQIDAQYLDSVDNGLSCIVEKFKQYPIAAHITLKKGERSELATLASEIL